MTQKERRDEQIRKIQDHVRPTLQMQPRSPAGYRSIIAVANDGHTYSALLDPEGKITFSRTNHANQQETLAGWETELIGLPWQTTSTPSPTAPKPEDSTDCL